MKIFNNRNFLTMAVLGVALASSPLVGSAQDRPRDDRRNDDRRNDDRRNDDRRADDRHDDRDRHENQSWRFRQEDRDRFRSHYQSNLREWERHPDRRHELRAGERLPADYRSRLRAVPPSYYRDMPPIPRGYRMGYYDGYVVAYDPATQIVADVLDLVNMAGRR